jgi:hypothetical protein
MRGCVGIMLLVLAFPGATQELVLCLCEDGHIRLEVQCDGQGCCPIEPCADEAACGGHDGPEAACPLAGHEHGCTDIPLPVRDGSPALVPGTSKSLVFALTVDSKTCGSTPPLDQQPLRLQLRGLDRASLAGSSPISIKQTTVLLR